MNASQKKFRRSPDKLIGGVCAGFADFVDVDVVLVRLVYAALSLFTVGFPGIMLYLLCWILVPMKEEE